MATRLDCPAANQRFNVDDPACASSVALLKSEQPSVVEHVAHGLGGQPEDLRCLGHADVALALSLGPFGNSVLKRSDLAAQAWDLLHLST